VAPPRRRSPKSLSDSWAIERLTELAERGSLSAGRELIHRTIHQCQRASRQHPELLDPALCLWLKQFLGRAGKNTRETVGDLIAPARAPRGSGQRPKSHAELIHDMSLAEEAYSRVKKTVDAGLSLKTAFVTVAEELNALGFRNSRNEPVAWHVIRGRYYEVCNLKLRQEK
jgi:hypothetical protein